MMAVSFQKSYQSYGFTAAKSLVFILREASKVFFFSHKKESGGKVQSNNKVLLPSEAFSFRK